MSPEQKPAGIAWQGSRIRELSFCVLEELRKKVDVISKLTAYGSSQTQWLALPRQPLSRQYRLGRPRDYGPFTAHVSDRAIF